MIKQQVYENILARWSGMEYSPGINLKTSIINMDKAKSLTIKNQPVKSTYNKKQFRCGSLEHLHITLKERPIGIPQQNEKKALDMGIYQK